MEARGRLSYANETHNIDKISYLHGHYLNAVFLVLAANPHNPQIRLQTF
jgi:hypothetical protein